MSKANSPFDRRPRPGRHDFRFVPCAWISRNVCKLPLPLCKPPVFPVTICTGRTLDYIRENLSALQLSQPVVTMQGAVIG